MPQNGVVILYSTCWILLSQDNDKDEAWLLAIASICCYVGGFMIDIIRFIKKLEVEIGDNTWVDKLKNIERENINDLNKWRIQNPNVNILNITIKKHSGRYIEEWFGSKIIVIFESKST